MTGADQFSFGSDSYSKEELVAEIGSMFICANTNIGEITFDNSTAYIAGWIKSFKNDPKMIITASSQAQKAVDWILNRKKEG